MAAEGVFPKSDGDVLYGSEANYQAGNFIQVEAGENLTAGNAVYVKLSDGKAYISDTGTADDIRTNGISVNAVTSGNSAEVQLSGKWTTSGLTANKTYYLGATGAISVTPSAVIVGYSISTTVLMISVRQDDAVGMIKSYAKSFTGVPSNNVTAFWVECDGSALSDAESPLNGETLPDLNGDAQFLYGAATSGSTKTENFLPNHRHNYLRSNNTNTSITTSSSTEDTTVGIIQYETAGTAWE